MATTTAATMSPGFMDSDLNVNGSDNNDGGFKNGTSGSPHFHQTAQVVFLFILFKFIVIGNLAVLVAIGVSKSGRRSRMNFFIMNLCIADLSNAFFNVLTDTIWKITVNWYAGQAGCKIFRFLQGVTQTAATYALVALSIDRLDAIARPLSFTGSGTRAKVLVGTAWGLSFLFSTPMIVLNKYEIMPDGFKNCWIFMTETWHWQVYITLIAISLFIIPAIIIAVCYGIIIFIVWVKSRDLLPKKKSKKSKTNGTILDDCDNDTCRSSDRSSSRGVIPQAKIRTIKMTLVIVIVFIICWTPYFLFDLLDVFGHIAQSSKKAATVVFINSLAPLNSAANPIIYGIFSTRICRNLRLDALRARYAVSSRGRSKFTYESRPAIGSCRGSAAVVRA
ncbi:cardioacceleratory peptide receptor-like isoform X2 [Lineus longissimus]|uniref:cardioacceleratory peptide receptor-like isoform X2 n=1 Tax=Lineus longissimus TaxID=88925 RepID=UPI002B4EC783